MAAPIFVADELVTAAKMNSLPKGVLGYAQVTASQGTITTEVDLTSLTVTVDVAASRRIRITGHIGIQRTVSDGITRLRIKESTTVLQIRDGFVRGAAEGVVPLHAEAALTPSSGSHTYKLTLARETGTGSTSLTTDATFPAFILVEDIGGV